MIPGRGPTDVLTIAMLRCRSNPSHGDNSMTTTQPELQTRDRVKMLDRRPMGGEPIGPLWARCTTRRTGASSRRSRSARPTRSIAPCSRPPRRLPAWAETPVVERARVMFRFRERLAAHAEELAGLVTREHGKTLAEARASVQRGIEIVEFACGVPSLIMGQSLANIARQVDCETIRHPVGVCAGITPFNFPAMVPLWMFPIAITCGNTFVLKPSEKVPLSAVRLGELLMESGLARGGLQHRARRPRVPSMRCLTHPAGPRGLVRRLDRGRPPRLRDRHAERQAGPGGRRGQEPPDHHARRRPRPGRRRTAALGVRLRRRALHGRQHRRARRPGRRLAGRAALPDAPSR